MFAEVSTILKCSPEKAWEEVLTTRLLNYVAYPLVTFKPVRPKTLPAVWREGQYLVELRLFGLIPLGRQWINITIPAIDGAAEEKMYRIRDNGHGDFVKKWDHWITISQTTEGVTRYTDKIEVSAGFSSPLVWLYAKLFYCHRQRRWRKLVRNDFVYGEGF